MSTDQVQQKIGTTADHWAAVEKDVTQWKHQAIQLEKGIAEAEVKKLDLQKNNWMMSSGQPFKELEWLIMS